MKTKYKILIISSIILCILVLCSGCMSPEERTAINTIGVKPLSDTKVNMKDDFILTVEHDSCKFIIYNTSYAGSNIMHHPNCKNHKDGKREKPK